jgi:hypothetical protein
VAHTFNPSIKEADMGGFQVLDQPELQNKILSQRKRDDNMDPFAVKTSLGQNGKS